MGLAKCRHWRKKHGAQAALATTVNMSRSTFSSKLMELVGQPAMGYLAQRRMQLAHNLLCETSLPLAAIAGRVGYESEAAFLRAFKRMYRVLPGRLRRTEL